MKRLLVLTTAVSILALAPPAEAGEYQVRSCDASHGNGAWAAEVSSGYVTAYTACPGEGIVTRMSGGAERAPNLVSASHVLAAPPGTRIVRLQGDFRFHSQNGWYVGFVNDAPSWAWCGSGCTSFGNYWPTDIALDTSWVRAQVTCFYGGGCVRSNQYGILAMQNVVVTIRDPTPPGVAITGGSLVVPGWRRGNQDISLSGWDSTGIRRIELKVDGKDAGILTSPCDFGRPRPCIDVSGVVGLPTGVVASDGRHVVTAVATDAADNQSAASREVLIDNTPPQQALDVRIEGGEGWRSRNGFGFGWRNPVQSAAPIGAVRYALCPVANLDGDLRGCAEGAVRGRGIASVPDLRVAQPGEWRLKLWLEDEAGNADRERAVSAGVLRFDDDVPAVRIAPFSDSDPTRVRVRASDPTSGIADGQVEARREGEDAWRSLPVRMEEGGFSAIIDDETLPRGRYELRARAVDRAGNERSAQTMANGDPATRTLPLRIATRLAVGAPKRIRARDARGRLRYRTVLRTSPRARYGRTIPLTGRLTMPGGNPLAGAEVEVWERIRLAAAGWRRVSALRTTRTGRFHFKALRGPSRTLKFRYPGTATIRSRTTQVELGVRAVTSFRANRTRVVNGEEIRFRGRLKGRQQGETGKLLHLQVFTRGRWSTFATPRADRVTGRWSEPYRFSATRGLVRYRFRVLIPREASFPYDTGTSRSVRVTVRGL